MGFLRWIKRWIKTWGTLLVAVIALGLSGYAIYVDNAHYKELTKPHTQHEEIYDKLLRLDTKIERARDWIRSWEDYGKWYGENTTDLHDSLNKAVSRSDEAEKVWRNKNYDKADKLINEAYNFLDEIPSYPPPVTPPQIPPVKPPINWWLSGGIIAGVIIIGVIIWLVARRKEVYRE